MFASVEMTVQAEKANRNLHLIIISTKDWEHHVEWQLSFSLSFLRTDLSPASPPLLSHQQTMWWFWSILSYPQSYFLRLGGEGSIVWGSFVVWWGFIPFFVCFLRGFWFVLVCVFWLFFFFLHVNEKYVFLIAVVNLKNDQEIYSFVPLTGMLPPMQDATRLLP